MHDLYLKSRLKSKGLALIFSIFLLVFITACGKPSQVELVRVVDGDTIVVKLEGKEEKVRLIGIDTPETVHPSKPVEPFGPEASAFTKRALEGKEIRLEFDVQERDKYGRLLAYLWVDGRHLNEELLKEGLAVVATFPPNVKYVDRFTKLQEEAREKEVGVWSDKEATGGKGTSKNAKFVASKKSDIYHGIGCPGGANKIKEENALYFKSEEEAIESGRRMCKSKECTCK